MTESIFSDHWYRVADLKPAIKEHVAITRHRYRGDNWWVLVDDVTGRQHRLDEIGYFLVAMMDGTHTVQAIWDEAMGKLDSKAPTQTEVIELLGRLHSADLFRTQLGAEVTDLFHRAHSQKASRKRRGMMNPLYLRVPLLDPDRFLGRLTGIGRLVFSRPMFLLWTFTVALALVLVYLHWGDIARSVHGGLLDPANLGLAVAAFLVMKVFHELSHGLAVKVWGGAVKDMGVVMLVFLPVPYVDASAANAFPEKHKRIITSAAGIMVELFLASLALLVWVLVEPGLVRQLALNVFLIGSLSTLFFNGNPLLRFDGYYVLADALEIPNLAGRAQSFVRYLLRRMLLGEVLEPPGRDRAERVWLAAYGLASACYRVLLLLAIALYLADTFFFVGVALAVWVVGTQLLWPLIKGILYMVDSSHSYLQRARVYSVCGGVVTALYLLLFVMPIPSTIPADGIVWLPDESVIRAETDCFVESLDAPSGARVTEGTLLISCSNPDLYAERDVLEARIGALQAKYRGYGLREQLERRVVADEIGALDAELRRVRERIKGLSVVSQAEGTFIQADTGFLPGRFYEKGQALGFVLANSYLTVKAAVPQEDIDLVSRHRSVLVRFAGLSGVEHEAFLYRQVPAATRQLPSAALGSEGGGHLKVDPEDPEGRLLMEDVYLIDLIFQSSEIPRLVGLRAHVLFRQGSTVIADVLTRRIHLLLMRRLSV